MDGFYEWQNLSNGTKQPHYLYHEPIEISSIKDNKDSLLYLAGIFDYCPANKIHSFTLITMNASRGRFSSSILNFFFVKTFL